MLADDKAQQPRVIPHFYDNRANEWLYVLVPFQVISLLLYKFVFAITRAQRYESINLIGAWFGLLSCVMMHGISKAAWLILCCVLSFRARKKAPRLFRKPSFIWSVACVSFACVAQLERKHTSTPLLAASGHIDTTGSSLLDGMYGKTSFHIFRAARYVVLRVVDYYLSSVTAGNQNATDDGDMITFLHYVFFAPLFQCGPLIRGGFDTFSKRLKKISSTRRFNAASKQNTIKRVARQFAKDALDLFGWFLVSNFLATSQTILSAPPSSSLRLLSRLLHIFATSRIAFNLGRVIAHAMLFTDVADDTPLFLYDCLASFRTLWWNFHVSFRDFFARNIYSKRESKTVAIALTFLVSACFHDVSFSDRRWMYFFLANTFGVLLERSRLLSSSVAAPKKEADERRRGVVLSSRLKAAMNRSCLWTLVVFSDGTIPHCVSNYARYFVKTFALSCVLS
jgi:D-alanyl-lipoteichoic acid acyltransferase DltB (MBOAT superfamily)